MNDGGPAFPCTHDTDHAVVPGRPVHLPGMSLRDWFAGMAIAGTVNNTKPDAYAEWAYQLADAMLKERVK